MLTEGDWAQVVRHWALKSEWARGLGPKPGEPGSEVPPAVQHRFGFDVVNWVDTRPARLEVEVLNRPTDFGCDRAFPLG
jgi:hypothetical protein